MRWTFYAFVFVSLYLTVCAVALPMLGRLLKRRREQIEAETEEVYGAPEGAGRWLQAEQTID